MTTTADITDVELEGPASGIFDIASGEPNVDGNGPFQGTINFFDNDGLLDLSSSFGCSEPVPFAPLHGTVNHFQAGDQIYFQNCSAQSAIYDPTSHVLTLYTGNSGQGNVDGQITLAGRYTTSVANGTLVVAPGGSFSGDNGNPILVTQGSATITTGTGASTVYLAGGGSNLFASDHGSAGGGRVITDFQGTDHLTLQGYGSNAAAAALGSATVSGGSTFLALQDGTPITLAGVTNLIAVSFV